MKGPQSCFQKEGTGVGTAAWAASAGAAPESPVKPFLSFSEVALLVQRLNAEGPGKGQVPPAGS